MLYRKLALKAKIYWKHIYFINKKVKGKPMIAGLSSLCRVITIL